MILHIKNELSFTQFSLTIFCRPPFCYNYCIKCGTEMLVVRTKSNHFGVDSSKISMQIICHFWTINPRFYIIFSILKLLFKVNPRYNTIYSLNFGPFRYHCRSFYVKNYGGRKINLFFLKIIFMSPQKLIRRKKNLGISILQI